jgi:2-oxoisovalerate dehydrogenase E1 component
MWQEKVIEIRLFEESLLELHKEGLISGTVHTCVGQELVAVSVCGCLNNDIDAVFATHRGHGFYISYGGDTKALFAEMTGREGAICLGRGGSQHLNFKNFYSNGIQGAGAVQAVGFAWGQKKNNTKGVTISQLGDGTLGQGSVYEAFNFASILQVPILFVVEINGWAQSTDTKETLSGCIEDRAQAFNIPFTRLNDKSPNILIEEVEKIINKVRLGCPHILIIETQRLLAHSKGDDDRDPNFLKIQFETDPLNVWIKTDPINSNSLFEKYKMRYLNEISEIKGKSIIKNVGTSSLPQLKNNIESNELLNKNNNDKIRVVEVLNKSLHNIFSKNEKCILIGEDVKDPYGGAFKVTKGLYDCFGDRIFSTPIAENAIIGVSIGLALSGYKPVAEIMFADFVTLGADQIINSAAKFYYMFGEKVICPIVVRLVSGGGRGYGPTHSQCLENLFCGIPGLRVIAISEYHDIINLLDVINRLDSAPVILVEDKRMYTRLHKINLPVFMKNINHVGDVYHFPSLVFKPVDSISDLTIVCYGQTVSIVEEALNKLVMEEEIFVDLIVKTQIWPLEINEVFDSLMSTKKILVVDPNEGSYSFGAALISKLALKSNKLQFSSMIVSSSNFPNPASIHLENSVLPTAESVFLAAKELVNK